MVCTEGNKLVLFQKSKGNHEFWVCTNVINFIIRPFKWKASLTWEDIELSQIVLFRQGSTVSSYNMKRNVHFIFTLTKRNTWKIGSRQSWNQPSKEITAVSFHIIHWSLSYSVISTRHVFKHDSDHLFGCSTQNPATTSFHLIWRAKKTTKPLFLYIRILSKPWWQLWIGTHGRASRGTRLSTVTLITYHRQQSCAFDHESKDTYDGSWLCFWFSTYAAQGFRIQQWEHRSSESISDTEQWQ